MHSDRHLHRVLTILSKMLNYLYSILQHKISGKSSTPAEPIFTPITNPVYCPILYVALALCALNDGIVSEAKTKEEQEGRAYEKKQM